MVIASERLGPVLSNIPLRPQWRLGPLARARLPEAAGSTPDGGPPAPGPPAPGGQPAQASHPGPAVPPMHIMIDFGDDELTAGRPHPMIDQSLRLDRLAADAADPQTGVILLDVVLGHGANLDPAAELGPAIAAARASRGVPVVVSLIGTAADPQGLDRQASMLVSAGAHVFASNAQAARYACDLIEAAR
jgi:FdrA protein